MDTIDISHNAIDCKVLEQLTVSMENFKHAENCKLATSRSSVKPEATEVAKDKE